MKSTAINQTQKVRQLFAILLIIFSTCLYSQSNSINYKALIKDGSGNVVANQSVTVQLTILSNAVNVYLETHTPNTDANGIVILNIGTGTTSDFFTDIDWETFDHTLNVQVDTGSGLVDLGTTSFNMVPYAHAAGNVSGLEKLTELQTGWRIKGVDPANYGTIGRDAIDLSISTTPSTTLGATGRESVALGPLATASGWKSLAIGNTSEASGTSSSAIGEETIASGNNATAIGDGAEASGGSSIALGNGTIAIGTNSTAMGNGTIASGTNSTAMGDGTEASGQSSTALGRLTEASGIYSTALGYNTTASGTYSTALGYTSSATVDYATAIGHTVVASGNHSIALGRNTISSGGSSIATGTGSQALGGASTAMGQNTIASGYASMATGINSQALGTRSFASGENTLATGDYSFATGVSTKADSRSSTTFGRFNIGGGTAGSWDPIESLFEIGNGADDANRDNALTVLKNGKVGIGNHQPSGFLEVKAENSGAQPNINLIHEGAIGARINFSNTDTTNGNVWTFYGDTNDTDANSVFNLFHTNTGNILQVRGDGQVGVNGVPDSDFHLHHGNNGGVNGMKLQNSSDNSWWRFYVSSSSDDLRLYSASQGTTIIGAFDDVSGAYTSSSDRRLKKNFEELHFNWTDFMKLETLSYNYKVQKDTKKHIGLVAQDVAPIYPELVNYNSDEDVYHLNYSGFGVVAIKAIQEQQKIIEGQASRIEELEAKLSEKETTLVDLNNRISTIEKVLNRLQ